MQCFTFILAQYRPVGGRLSNQEMRTCRSSKINPGVCSLLHLRNTICAWNNSNIHIKQRTLGKRKPCTAVFFSLRIWTKTHSSKLARSFIHITFSHVPQPFTVLSLVFTSGNSQLFNLPSLSLWLGLVKDFWTWPWSGCWVMPSF